MGCFCPSYSKYFEALPFLIVFVLGGWGRVVVGMLGHFKWGSPHG